MNVPALSRYLAAHFTEIPDELHTPIIASAFAAAQKVAAMYAEAVLTKEDERTVAARKSMARWMHGLSAVESKRPKASVSERESGVSSGVDIISPWSRDVWGLECH